MEKNVSKFPTEIVDLPSKGWFYPLDSVLSSGKIEIKYPGALQEDILTSVNLIRQGNVIDKFLESIIITPISLNDLLIGDKNGIMIVARILAYGKDYNIKISCPSCEEKTNKTIDLTKIQEKSINFEKYTKGINRFSFKLPISQKEIVLRLSTGKEEQEIDEEVKALRKFTQGSSINPNISVRLKKLIIELDGSNKKEDISIFIDRDIISRDILAIREFMNEITPDIDLNVKDFICDDCGREELIPLPIDTEFFWPAGRK